MEEFSVEGENWANANAATRHTCKCGTSRYVDGGDKVECPCGMTLEYFEDEHEHTGYLHERADA